MEKNFIHLHLHTEYSMLDGAIKLNDLIKKLASDHQFACAMTDHGNMFGAIEFYRVLTGAGLKPIIGCEFYVAPNSRFQKEKVVQKSYHLTALAKDHDGYMNLIKLNTIGYKEGFYYKPRIDMEVLAEHHEGLIILSGCMSGKIPILLLKDDIDGAIEECRKMKEILGDENFYLELMYHELPNDQELIKKLVALSKKTGVPLVATNDAHYLSKEISEFHDILLAIQTNKVISDTDRLTLGSDTFYLKTGEEMWRIFNHIPDALNNTLKICEKCNLKLEFKKPNEMLMPEYTVPDKFKISVKSTESPKNDYDRYIEHICNESLKKIYSDKDKNLRKQAKERMNYELSVIKKMNYSRYFLIVHDFISYARGEKIPIGPGRGSVVGSLVAYLLEITKLDPIEYGLIFERFLNPSRISSPDIDVDVADEYRNKILKYIINKYGRENVSSIISFSRMKARNTIRDIGRVLEIPLKEVDEIAKMIPEEINITIESAIKKEPKLNNLYNSSTIKSRLLKAAIPLQGLIRNSSIHASGLVITDKALSNYVPMFKTSSKDNKNILVPQYDMKSIEKIGLVKWDILGLKTLSVINRCEKLIGKYENKVFSVDGISLTDKKTFALLQTGDTVGVFQIVQSGFQKMIRELRPDNINDVIAGIALYRPGPLQTKAVEEFIENKRKKKKDRIYKNKLDRELYTILEETYGTMVYQEQIMMIANKIANFSMSEADLLRKAIAKKEEDIMEKLRNKFIENATGNGYHQDQIEILFSNISKFCSYGFNKSHSAAYALLTYITAYLKAHYTVYFMCSLLSSEKGNTDKLIHYINETKRLKIKILPPDVNFSMSDFTIEEGAIRFGLNAIKNVGTNAIAEIIEERSGKERYNSIYDFARRINQSMVNRKAIESLIKAGAFDSADNKIKRSQMFTMLNHIIETSQSFQEDKKTGQGSLLNLFSDDDSFKKNLEKYPPMDEWDTIEKLNFEDDVLGFYLSGHPIEKYFDLYKDYSEIRLIKDIEEMPENRRFYFLVLFQSIKKKITRQGSSIIRGFVEDMTSRTRYFISSSKLANMNDNNISKGVAKLIVAEKDFTGNSLTITNIYPITKARHFLTRTIHLYINENETPLETINNLKKEIRRFPGAKSVFFHLSSDNIKQIVLSTSSKFNIAPREPTIRNLKKILGDENVKFNIKV